METVRAMTFTDFMAKVDELLLAGRDEELLALWGEIKWGMYPTLSSDERRSLYPIIELATRIVQETPPA